MSDDIWKYRTRLAYDRPLEPDDDLRVDFSAARGRFTHDRLLRQLGVNLKTDELRLIDQPPQYLLFGGHRGCGKSTELRWLARRLNHPSRYFVVFLDVLDKLDMTNVRYSDVALAQAEELVDRLAVAGVDVPDVYLERLVGWFFQRIERVERLKEYSAEVEAGAEGGLGLPFLGKLFAKVRTAIKNKSSYKDELRREVRDNFAEFAEACNQLLGYCCEAVQKQGLGRSIVFVVDGLDRLEREDAPAFFLHDIHQLKLVRTHVVYCAPIHILSEEGQIGQNYDGVFRLPMLKLADKGGQPERPETWDSLRDFVDKRLPLRFFDDQATVDMLISRSGGHPRDLMRLLSYCLQQIDDPPITAEVARVAERSLASEYQRVVQQADYALLAKIDREPPSYVPITDDTRRLLYNLALLEYNAFWWQSHPAVTLLPAYAEARSELGTDKAAGRS